MTPLTGTIVRMDHVLMIRLNSGGSRIKWPLTPAMKLGETVHIIWDFTNDRPRRVMTDAEYHHNAEDDNQFEAGHPGDLLPIEHWE
jgi:hypothetical protein